jgi:hypothetical protein
MIDKARHIAGAADAVAVFQKHCGTGDEHAIVDLICDLGHLVLIASISDQTLQSKSPSRQDDRSSHCCNLPPR